MGDGRSVEAFQFAFEPPLDTWARRFAIVPARSFVRLDDHGFEAVYGPWRVATTWSNVIGVERSGPYRAWKVAGPARVSWADRGLTLAATTAGGVCIRLRQPIPGIDPLGVVKHPGVTLAVDDVDGFMEAVRSRLKGAGPTPTSDEAGPPSHDRGGLIGTARALWNWHRRDIVVDERDVERVQFPGNDRADDTDEQPPEVGVGPPFHRSYRIVVDGAGRPPEAAMAAIQADPNVLADRGFAPVVKTRGRSGEMVVGDRYLIQLAGPWKGAVEVIDVGDRSFRLATLEGNMESGCIEMRATAHDDDRIEFTIESWARSHDRAFDLIYDKLGLAKALQGEMWAIACERFVELAGGTPVAPLEVATERETGAGSRR